MIGVSDPYTKGVFMDLVNAYERSLAEFTSRVPQVHPDQWSEPTPCADWNVHELVSHLVGEDRWAVPLFAGATIDDVGDQLSGDLLGDDPATAAAAAAEAARAAVTEPGALDRVVHLSFGDTPAPEYLYQLTADHLIHSWDLAVSIGIDPQLDPQAIKVVSEWFHHREEMYRNAGAIGPPVEVPEDADEQDRLIAAFGRDPNWS